MLDDFLDLSTGDVIVKIDIEGRDSCLNIVKKLRRAAQIAIEAYGNEHHLLRLLRIQGYDSEIVVHKLGPHLVRHWFAVKPRAYGLTVAVYKLLITKIFKPTITVIKASRPCSPVTERVPWIHLPTSQTPSRARRRPAKIDRLPTKILSYYLNVRYLTFHGYYRLLYASLAWLANYLQGTQTLENYLKSDILVKTWDGFLFIIRARTPDLYTVAVAEKFEIGNWFKPLARGVIVDGGHILEPTPLGE